LGKVATDFARFKLNLAVGGGQTFVDSVAGNIPAAMSHKHQHSPMHCYRVARILKVVTGYGKAVPEFDLERRF
jgi:hypothetical protein